jgi:hypothetical protein
VNSTTNGTARERAASNDLAKREMIADVGMAQAATH